MFNARRISVAVMLFHDCFEHINYEKMAIVVATYVVALETPRLYWKVEVPNRNLFDSMTHNLLPSINIPR